jgi:pyrroloquinoline-quinone synthase
MVGDQMTTYLESFFSNLEAQISSKHLLEHDFYKAWSRGELSIEVLQEYAKEYYQHVKAFPMYLSALHSHTECATTRKHLLQNLIEEEAGSPNHPELWRAFAKALHVTDAELDAHQPGFEMQALIQTFTTMCRNSSVAEGISALYSYESQIPAICHSKIEGLQTHYGMLPPSGYAYFSVHIAADEEHARVERELLSQHVTEKNSRSVLEASDKALQALWNFLSHLCVKHRISCA